MTLELSGKVVIVTGGGKGVGRGITQRFLGSGADVVICGRKEPETLPSTAGKSLFNLASMQVSATTGNSSAKSSGCSPA